MEEEEEEEQEVVLRDRVDAEWGGNSTDVAECEWVGGCKKCARSANHPPSATPSTFFSHATRGMVGGVWFVRREGGPVN